MSGTASVLVLHADREPRAGVANRGPRDTYRNPRLRIEERALGAVAPGCVRVEMVYAGVCGTDVHTAAADPDTGYVVGSAPLDVGPAGRVLGHEGVGRVVEVGERAGTLRRGDLVTFESIVHCHACDPCRRGAFNQCERAVLLGMERDGLFGTIVDVPASLAHDVSDLDGSADGLRAAACVEPAACAFVACSMCRVAAGDDVVIFGAGPIGLFAAMLCRLAFGAARVTVVEPVAFRRDLAARWAHRVRSVEEFRRDPGSARIDVLLEASGAVENVTDSFRLLGANARVALLARSGRPLSIDAVDHMITRNVSIHGSRGHLGGAFTSILRLVRAGALPLHEAVTDVVDGLPALRDALTDPSRITERNCKVLVRPCGAS